MSSRVSELAGKVPTEDRLVDLAKLEAAYYDSVPDPSIASQRVAFGTSGHRGSAFDVSFNEAHILAITQAICLYRAEQGTNGPLFIGRDTHALSRPALESALEVLAANDIDTMIDSADGFTPTPAISRAILAYNKGRSTGLADGIVITPSHNPPEDGGFKYNPPHGGPADTDATGWIERKANEILAEKLASVRRVPVERARRFPCIHPCDYIAGYVADLKNVIDFDVIRSSAVSIGIDPLGGSAVHYWQPIIDMYGIKASIVSDTVDPTFRFMTADWDGKIRMDCSSPYAMARLIGLRDRFDVAFANDTDADRHGIVTRSGGLMNPNHYLTAAIAYLFENRPGWKSDCAVGKTVVSSSSIDRITAKLGRQLIEVPVGGEWFVEGLMQGSLGFGGEESAGASFLRRDGSVWTTDKDGLILGLLAAEMTARTGHDPSQAYAEITAAIGAPCYERIDAPASAAQKAVLKGLTAERVGLSTLAGEPITSAITAAPGNGQSIGGIKISTADGWFAARPSGTEEVYKLYAESFRDEAHLRQLQTEAQAAISRAFAEAGA
jgi:phosphoglucomutase